MQLFKRVSAVLLVLAVLLSCCGSVFAAEIAELEAPPEETNTDELPEETVENEPQVDEPDALWDSKFHWRDGIPASVIAASEDGAVTASVYLPECSLTDDVSASVSWHDPDEEETDSILNAVGELILSSLPEELAGEMTVEDLGDISYMVGTTMSVHLELTGAAMDSPSDYYYAKLFFEEPIQLEETQNLMVFRKTADGILIPLYPETTETDARVDGVYWWDAVNHFGSGEFYVAVVENIDYSIQPASDSNQVASGIESPSHGTAIPSPGGPGDNNGSGSYCICSGVEMQVVYYKYKDTNNATKAHGNIVSTLQAPETTAYDINGNKVRTIYDGVTFNKNQFVMFPGFSWGNSAVYRVTWPYTSATYPESLSTTNRWDQWGTYRANWGKDLSTRIPPFGTVTNPAVDKFLRYIILSPYNRDMVINGTDYNYLAQWDRSDVDRDNSLFEQVLAELISGSEYTTAVTNYKKAIQGQLPTNSEALIPAIIWTWIGGDSATFGNNSEKYMTMYTGYGLWNHKSGGDNLPSNNHWWYTPFNSASSASATCPFGSRHGVGEFACRIAFGTGHSHCGNVFWTQEAPYLNGVGIVNRISKTDATGKTGPYYYLRGYWTPFDIPKNGNLSVSKTISPSSQQSAQAANWKFELYSSAANASAGTNVIASAYTNASGVATFNDLTAGVTYYVREAPASRQDKRSDVGNWTLSTTVLSSTVDAGVTKSVGSANNTANARVKIQKVANCSAAVSAQLTGNGMYSLAGAKYQIKVGGSVTETLTTAEFGNATSTKLYPIGTKGTIRETTAPKGYLLDSTEYSFEVKAGGTTVTVKDTPTFDPEVISIRKTDAATGTPQGDASFAGAIFKWEYYDNTEWSGNPVRTWHFRTNEKGQHAYDASFLAGGYTNSDLYVNTSGMYSLPLGSVKITETVAPAGYKIMPTLYATITQDSTGKATWHFTASTLSVLRQAGDFYEGSEPINEEIFGSVTIQKKDSSTNGAAPSGATFAGCEFTVYNRSANAVQIGTKTVAPGGACCVLTVGTDGSISSGKIFPMGTYEILETKGNPYYPANNQWTFRFTVDGKTNAPVFNAVCTNTLYPGKVTIQKVDGTGNVLSGVRLALEWNNGTSWKRVTKSSNLEPGGCSSASLDADGCLRTDTNGVAEFTGLYPTLKYRVIEVETTSGHTLLTDCIAVTLVPEKGFEAAYRIVNGNAFTLPNTGSMALRLTSITAALFAAIGVVLLTTHRRKKAK